MKAKQQREVDVRNVLSKMTGGGAGLSYKGPRKSGLSSMGDPDGEQYYVNQLSKYVNYTTGQIGVNRFMAVDENGKPIVSKHTMNVNGQIATSNDKGVFSIVDSSYLKKVREYAEEKDKYINRVMQLCISSDEVCQTVLGFSSDEYKIRMNGDVPGLDKDSPINKANATVSVLNALPQDSKEFSYGLAKLKAIIKIINPTIDDNGNPTDADMQKVDPSLEIEMKRGEFKA